MTAGSGIAAPGPRRSGSPDTDLAIRHLESDHDYRQCLRLQRATWGEDFNDLVPPAMLMVAQKVSGLAAGAFRGEHMLGFVFSLAGYRDGRVAHWSHMLAVDREARGLGLGKRLKLFQRDVLLGLGVEVVYWSYDPLVARNANLNINGLGALPREYVRDMYGGDTGSDLHSALGTDRFVAVWEIASPRVEAVIGGERPPAPLPDAAERLLNADLETGRVREPALLERDALWVEVPANIEATKRADLQEARAWRASTRAAFEGAFALRYRVAGLAIGDPGGAGKGERYFYYLRREGQEP